MTRALNLGENLDQAHALTAPLQFATDAVAFIGKRGSGKTYAAGILVEEFAAAGAPFCVIDPVGVWWGLRSSVDGKSDGIPVTILGGEHGDAPLDPLAGELIAEAVVQDRASIVLDLSLMKRAQQVRFVAAFADRLYELNREVYHLAIDEADTFAPQKPWTPEQTACLGAVDRLVRQGRAKGLGVSLISQRAAVLNKNVLTQADTLIAFRVTGKPDRKAVEDWIVENADDEQGARIMAEVSSLPTGEAFLWSPDTLKLLARVRFRTRRTFDSSATPKVGEKRVLPKRIARVDLEKLTARMRTVAEKAKQDDPRALRAEITRLTKLNAEKAAFIDKSVNTPPSPRVERVEVPTLTEPERAQLAEVVTCLKAAHSELGELGTLIPVFNESLIAAKTEYSKAALRLDTLNAAIARLTLNSSKPASASTPALSQPASRSVRGVLAAPPSSEGITAPMQRMLDSLAELHRLGYKTVPRMMLGGWGNVDPGSGYFDNVKRPLLERGYIAQHARDGFYLTDTGISFAHPPPAPTTIIELRDRVLTTLDSPGQRMLSALIDEGGRAIGRKDLGEKSSVDPTSGYFDNVKRPLIRRGLMIETGRGQWVAAEWLLKM